MPDDFDPIDVPAGDKAPGEVTVILVGIRRGEDGARAKLFELVYSRLREMVAPVLRGHPLVGQREEPDDIVSRLWMRLERAFLPCDPKNSREFFRIVNHKLHQLLVDLSRKYRGPAAGPLGLSPEADGLDLDSLNAHGIGGPPPPNPPTWVAETDEVRLLLAAINRLEEEERELYRLKYYMGMGPTDIAEILGVSAKTIHRRLEELENRVVELRLQVKNEEGAGRDDRPD